MPRSAALALAAGAAFGAAAGAQEIAYPQAPAAAGRPIAPAQGQNNRMCFGAVTTGVAVPVAGAVVGSAARGEAVGPTAAVHFGCGLGGGIEAGLRLDQFFLDGTWAQFVLGSIGWGAHIGSGDRLKVSVHGAAGISNFVELESVTLVLRTSGRDVRADGPTVAIGGGVRFEGPISGRLSWVTEAALRTAFLTIHDFALGEDVGTSGFTLLPLTFGVRLAL